MVDLIGRSIAQYKITQKIGFGGMATVFKAVDLRTNRLLAIKVLTSIMAQNGQFLERFRREAEIASKLAHPHIVPLEAYGEENGLAYLVMPYYAVGSLEDRLRQGPLKPREGALMVQQISEALEYAHGQGLVHRDVKPSNILLDEDGNAHLADFGLVFLEDASLNLTGSAVVGTPGYISPEQALGHRVDPRADQYSLGILMFLLVTGQMPYDGETPVAVLLKHVNEPLPSPRDRQPKVPETIEQVIYRATEKDPEARFDSVAEANEAFQAAVAHALDPDAHPAPTLHFASPSVESRQDTTQDPEKEPFWRKPAARLVAAAAIILLALLICQATASSFLSRLGRDTLPGGPGVAAALDIDPLQVTAMSGTMAAMSTELAGNLTGTVDPSLIETSVMQTVVAMATATGALPDPISPISLTTTATPFDDLTPGSTTATAPVPGQTAAPPATAVPTQNPGTGPTASPPPSSTPKPSATPMPTRTSSPPPAPTHTPVNSPTATNPPPPTNTPPPPPTHTATPLPSPTPSPTATVDPCAWITLTAFAASEDDVRWKINNGSAVTIEITTIHLNWPTGNEELREIQLAGNTLWDEEDDSPPTTVQSNWGPGSRTINSGVTKTLKFFFGEEPASSGYNLTLTFDNGCQVSAGN